MGFVVYVPPQDFSRSGQAAASDNAAAFRGVTVMATSLATASNNTANITLWRPPVILVHGLWGDQSDWNNFTPFVASTTGTPGDPRFNIPGSYSVHRGNYNYPIGGSLSNSNPNYANLSSARSNSLGFEFNAPVVLNQIQEAIVDFRQSMQAAATQVDVVAHSMGGTVTRRLEYLPQYTDGSSFGMGNVHKLITIGTPHLGSNLAGQLLQDGCVRNVFALKTRFAINTVSAGGMPTTGGVGDLQGDGFNDANLSNALIEIQASTPQEVPTFTIAGTMIAALQPPSNTSNLACSAPCNAATIRECGVLFGSTLGNSLTPLGWPSVFGAPPNASDAVVPLNSQLNGNLSAPQVFGVIHSAGLEDLDFTGPAELDPSSDIDTIQNYVIGALNLSVNSSFFSLLP